MDIFLRTLGINGIFLMLIPFLMAWAGMGNIALILYLPIISLMELLHDITYYRRSEIAKLPDKFPIREFLITIVFNAMMMYSISFIFSIMNTFRYGVSGQQILFYTLFLCFVSLIAVSTIELMVDRFMYKNG